MASYDDFTPLSEYLELLDCPVYPESQDAYADHFSDVWACDPSMSAMQDYRSPYQLHPATRIASHTPSYGQLHWSAAPHAGLDQHSLSSTSQRCDSHPPGLSSSSESGDSLKSAASSAIGSPCINSVSGTTTTTTWTQPHHGSNLAPAVEQADYFDYPAFGIPSDSSATLENYEKSFDFMGSYLLTSFENPPHILAMPPSDFNVTPVTQEPVGLPTSPAPSTQSLQAPRQSGSRKLRASSSHSPYLHQRTFEPYPHRPQLTRNSTASSDPSWFLHGGPSSETCDVDEEKEKGQCPIPECGRIFKDLKAHMLTHLNERPEKCPIVSCEYHTRGFARRYDKNRHTLTHYKGTMICGFCPGAGSPSEKTFNRADVFKRHLTKMHGVEQIPPNGRKKSPKPGQSGAKATMKDARGKCSTCSMIFENAQELYEHLDECVLRVVQQIDPCEAINEKALRSVAEDEVVKETLDRHCIPHFADLGMSPFDDEPAEADIGLDQEGQRGTASDKDLSGTDSRHSDARNPGKRAAQGHNAAPSKRVQPSSGFKGRAGLTYSRGGVTLVGRSRNKRKDYPLSWGLPADRIKMKKRVLCVYDGPRRLVKDDMMLDTQFEVRVKLPYGNGDSYVTDLDIETMKRAEGFHNASAEEKGPWLPDNVRSYNLEELMA